jgi:ATP/maltotriose-dependent transcriptional regulator MalT
MTVTAPHPPALGPALVSRADAAWRLVGVRSAQIYHEARHARRAVALAAVVEGLVNALDAAGVPMRRTPTTDTPVPELTKRERQVLSGMSRGRSNAEIGRELFVSEDTVKTHARRLYRKLGARDRAHAVAQGFHLGLLT